MNILIGGTPYAALIRSDDAAPPLAGDFDGNLVVDGADFLAWQRNFGATGATRSQGDADADGVIGANDLLGWKQTFGVGGGLTAMAVTAAEPMTAPTVDVPLASSRASGEIAETAATTELALPFLGGLAAAGDGRRGAADVAVAIECRARNEAFAHYRVEASNGRSAQNHSLRRRFTAKDPGDGDDAQLADSRSSTLWGEQVLHERCFEDLVAQSAQE